MQGVQFRGAFPTRLKAVHMSLIPKGPHQGRVLVWDIEPIVGTPPPGQTSASGAFSYQAYSIVDPSPVITPPNVRFRNFLLPIGPVTFPSPGLFQGGDLFCSGHVWSPFGDLVVVGGTDFIPQSGGLANLPVHTTFVFDPNTPSLNYPGELGRWYAGPPLLSPRYYPTAVLTGAMPTARLNGSHAVLVLGGDTVVGGTPSQNPTWNLYEALEVRSAPDSFTGASNLFRDTFTNASGASGQWSGPPPSSPANPFLNELWFYPRCHLLTNGKVFMSGFVPLSSAVDHVTTQWDQFPGHALVAGNWNQHRYYGASLRYPNIGGSNNLIVRIGGGLDPATTAPFLSTTNTVETCDADDPFANWRSVFPLNVPRANLNVVVLPDASLLAVGGVDGTGLTVTSQFQPEIYLPGAMQWQLLPPAFSVRDYHSTALLLPDGRVIVGGGDDHLTDINGGQNGFDYEVFTPPYFAPQGGGVAVGPQIQGITSLSFDPSARVHDLGRGTTHTVQIAPLPLGMSVERAVLMAPGSTTHHSDMSQRYHLMTTKPSPTQVSFSTPASSTILPAGIYMLFLVTNTGVPSTAVWVRLP